MRSKPVPITSVVEARHRSRVQAWYTVGVFMLLYGISYVDRLILALLAPAISARLQISDTEIGVLIGLGFGVLYSAVGLPLAHFIDRSRRTSLVAGDVLLWSMSTIASAFAPDFLWLMIFRSGVAIGEAVLSPAAVSLIADLFPRDKRTLPMTLYTGVGAVMYSGAYIADGAALQLATAMSRSIGLAPWQFTLVLVGLPGLLLALLLRITISEPPRTGELASESFATASQAWAYLSIERKLYGGLFLCNAAVSMINFAVGAWTPTLLIRGHGMGAAQAGYAFGAVGLVSSVLGVAIWPGAVKLWSDRGRKDALVAVFGMTLTASSISFVVVGCTRLTTVLLIFAAIGTFFSAALGVLVPLLIQSVAPGRMRARIMALYLTSASLVGLAAGPPLAALLSEHFFTGPFAIGSGLAMLVIVTGPVATLSAWSIRKPYCAALEKAEAREATT